MEYPIRTPAHLPGLLVALRKEKGLTQQEMALRLGVTQQTVSALERNAENVSAARLVKLLGILGVELVVRTPGSPTAANPPEADPGSREDDSAEPRW